MNVINLRELIFWAALLTIVVLLLGRRGDDSPRPAPAPPPAPSPSPEPKPCPLPHP